MKFEKSNRVRLLDWNNVYSINRFLLGPFSQDICTSVTNISTDTTPTKTRSPMLTEKKNIQLRHLLYQNMPIHSSGSPEPLTLIAKTQLCFLPCKSAFVCQSIQGRGLYLGFLVFVSFGSILFQSVFNH